MNYVSNVMPITFIDRDGARYLCDTMTGDLINKIEALGGIISSKIEFEGTPYSKLHYWIRFPNNGGYTASIIKGWCTYGGEDDRWELAVLSPYGGVSYNTDVSPGHDDVLGYLSDDELLTYLDKLSRLDEDGHIKEDLNSQTGPVS